MNQWNDSGSRGNNARGAGIESILIRIMNPGQSDELRENPAYLAEIRAFNSPLFTRVKRVSRSVHRPRNSVTVRTGIRESSLNSNHQEVTKKANFRSFTPTDRSKRLWGPSCSVCWTFWYVGDD